MGTGPRPSHFPVRNRIIAGLSRAVVVVEATERSGSLITARLGLEQGRDVFAVPGPIDAARSRGTHQLIRAGARLITSGSDVLEELGFPGPATPCVARAEASCAAAELARDAESVLAALGDGPLGVDALIAETGLTLQDVLRILLQLELSGVARQLPGVVFGICGQEKQRLD
jgi:DNA processing protein